MAPVGRGIAKAEDLKGKTIGIAIARDRGAAARKLDPKIVDPLDDDSHVSRGTLSSPRRRRDRLGGVIVGPVHAARSIDQPLDDGRYAAPAAGQARRQ